MAYYQANKTFETSSTQRINVFEYRNSTKLRLFCNRLDLLPNVFFAKNGIIEIYKNGILEYTNEFQNDLARYSHYSVRQRIRWLERDEDLKIYVKSKKEKDIKITMTIALDWADEPQPAVLVPFSTVELSSVAEEVSLLSKEIINDTAPEENVYPFDIIGYSKILVSILINDGYHPTLIYNDVQDLPSETIGDLEGMTYGSRFGTLTLTNGASGAFPTLPYPNPGRSVTLNRFKNWVFADENFNFRNGAGQIIDPENIRGTAVISEALYEMNNTEHENNTYDMSMESPNNFRFDKKFQYLSRLNYYLHLRFYFRTLFYPTERLIFTYIGKRVYLTSTYQLVVEGSNSRNFSSGVTPLKIIDNYNGLKQNFQVTTNLEFVRIQKKITYRFTVVDANESITLQGASSTSGNDDRIVLPSGEGNNYNGDGPYGYGGVGDKPPLKYITANGVWNNLPVQGQEYLPNMLSGWNDVNFPDIIPQERHAWSTAIITETPNPQKLEIDHFNQIPLPTGNITIALESKGVDDVWFPTIADIGTVASLGKTLITLSEFNLENPLIAAKGQKLTRFKVTTDSPIELSIGLILTN